MVAHPSPLQTAKSVTRVFHDTEYTIRIHVDDNGLTIDAETGSFALWRSHFPSSLVEEIARRCGNAKPFAVFLKMLISALDEESSAVHLDLLTARDLDMLRQRQDLRPPNSTDTSNKRYLILTYTAEFDKVHYPLALEPVELDTVESLREVIQQLRWQLDCGASKEVAMLQRENEQLRAEAREAEMRALEAERRVGLGRESAELRHLKQSLSKYQNEVTMLRDAKQRLAADHRKVTEQLQKELVHSKSEIRRMEAQLRREMSRRGGSPHRPASPALSGLSCSSVASSSGSHRPRRCASDRSVPTPLRNPSRMSSSTHSFHSAEPRRFTRTAARQPSEARRPNGLERPASKRYRNSERSLSPVRRPASRSLSPSLRTYVSPYAQRQPPRIPQPPRSSVAMIPQPPRSNTKKACGQAVSPSDSGPTRSTASPRPQMRAVRNAPVISDIDARLTALQKYLRNNTLVEP